MSDNSAFVQTPTGVEGWVVDVFAFAQPVLTLLMIVAFVGAALLLAIKTKAAGRFLILGGVIGIILIEIAAQIITREPGFGVTSELSMMKVILLNFLSTAVVLVGVAGFVRLVWWLYKGRHSHGSA